MEKYLTTTNTKDKGTKLQKQIIQKEKRKKESAEIQELENIFEGKTIEPAPENVVDDETTQLLSNTNFADVTRSNKMDDSNETLHKPINCEEVKNMKNYVEEQENIDKLESSSQDSSDKCSMIEGSEVGSETLEDARNNAERIERVLKSTTNEIYTIESEKNSVICYSNTSQEQTNSQVKIDSNAQSDHTQQRNCTDYNDLNRKHNNIFENSTEVFEPISLHLGCKLAESSSKTDELLGNMNLQKVDQSNYNDKGKSCALKYSNIQPDHKVTKICKRSLKDVDEPFESLVKNSRGVLKSKQVYRDTLNEKPLDINRINSVKTYETPPDMNYKNNDSARQKSQKISDIALETGSNCNKYNDQGNCRNDEAKVCKNIGNLQDKPITKVVDPVDHNDNMIDKKIILAKSLRI